MKVIENQSPVPWKIGTFLTHVNWLYKTKFIGTTPCSMRRGYYTPENWKPCNGCPTGGIAIKLRRLRKRLGPMRIECAGWTNQIKFREWTDEDEARWQERINRS